MAAIYTKVARVAAYSLSHGLQRRVQPEYNASCSRHSTVIAAAATLVLVLCFLAELQIFINFEATQLTFQA
jgi:hypothetical protein